MAESILVVDDEEIIRESLSFVLKKEGFTVEGAENGRAALHLLGKRSFDLVITDLEMPEMKGIELLGHIASSSPDTLVIIITAYGSIETAIAALRKGAVDYILKPIEFDELLVKVRRLFAQKRLQINNRLLRAELHKQYDFANIIGKSEAMQRVFETIKRVAQTDGTVLITGRSGTGKELVGRAIHFNGKRKDQPFIAVNCGAVVENLFESELFGHKKGAFTGASTDRIGYFKSADGGTLFLDEVSEIPLHLQVKLLRAIELKEVTPVGTSHPVSVDVRIVATTNRNLEQYVVEGKFREDLFYRLNVVNIDLPPLSNRPADVPLLVEHFVKKYAMEMKKDVKGVAPETMRILTEHAWKGEVRELENVIERAVIFADRPLIAPNDLPPMMSREHTLHAFTAKKTLKDAVADFERDYITHMLRTHPNKEELARILHISLSSLYRKIDELGIGQAQPS
jgi:two-component system response regulator PilR (NtrC family)